MHQMTWYSKRTSKNDNFLHKKVNGACWVYKKLQGKPIKLPPRRVKLTHCVSKSRFFLEDSVVSKLYTSQHLWNLLKIYHNILVSCFLYFVCIFFPKVKGTPSKKYISSYIEYPSPQPSSNKHSWKHRHVSKSPSDKSVHLITNGPRRSDRKSNEKVSIHDSLSTPMRKKKNSKTSNNESNSSIERSNKRGKS